MFIIHYKKLGPFTRAFLNARLHTRHFNIQWSSMGLYTRCVACASDAEQTPKPARTCAFFLTPVFLLATNNNESLHTSVFLASSILRTRWMD